MSWLADYFGLPAGAVWSNLIASLICVGVAWWRLRARLVRHHVQALHHKQQLAQAEKHHQDMKAHVTAQRAPMSDADIRKAARIAGTRWPPGERM